MPRVSILATTLLAVLASPASAAITPTRDAGALAGAMAAPGTTVTGAGFDEIPVEPTSAVEPNALSDSSLGGFPTDGGNYAILTSGDAASADDPQDSQASATAGDNTKSRGNALDVSVLRIDLSVPTDANCLSFGFRFYSEEYPTFVGQAFNDGFIAQLDSKEWSTETSSGAITAPGNFAYDPNNDVISINSTGATSMSGDASVDTVYGGGTQRLFAAGQISSGPHSLYLSIFDQSDSGYDSAVFVDSLQILNAAPGTCVSGAQPTAPTVAPPLPTPTPPPQQAILGQTVVPEPVQGKTVRVGVVSGKIRIKRRGSSSFEELDGIEGLPVGSTVDATQGRMRLTTATGVAGATQTADFYQGEFQVLQSKNSATTELKLAGDSLASCRSKRARSSAKRKPVRRLFGDGKGSFRTRGRHAAATVRGTKWLTQDTCKGTLVRVSRGTVKVRDFTRKRTVTVRQGRSYLARPPR